MKLSPAQRQTSARRGARRSKKPADMTVVYCEVSAAWPKVIYVRGVGVLVRSWAEVDELMERYGAT